MNAGLDEPWSTQIQAAFCNNRKQRRPICGPSEANEGSRWEAATAGRGAPTGPTAKTSRAPARRMTPASCSISCAPPGRAHPSIRSGGCAWFHQASHRLLSSAPPAREVRPQPFHREQRGTGMWKWKQPRTLGLFVPGPNPK